MATENPIMGDENAADTLVFTGKVDRKYRFQRPDSVFRQFITRDGSSGFPAEADRYHLYVSLLCPWACRCIAVLNLKGLQDIISVTCVKPLVERTRPDLDEHMGWAFARSEGEEPRCSPDPLNNAKFIRDLYEMTDSEASKKGRYSVPVLWDIKTNRIVNNESSEIIRMLNTEFNHLAKNPELDLYPEPLRRTIDELNEWIYHDVNNGVYKVMFATTQEDYNTAVTAIFAGLDRAESILAKQRYLAGDRLTEADIRFFVTLIRFDEVYYNLKCNKRLIREYPNLFNYTKELFQRRGINETVDFYHFRKGYFLSGGTNPYKILPIGSLSWVDWSSPHDRDRFST